MFSHLPSLAVIYKQVESKSDTLPNSLKGLDFNPEPLDRGMSQQF